MIDWHSLFVAIALVLILEGILPFANPGGLRRTLQVINQLTDQQLRVMGVSSMVAGLVLLYLTK
ncbi:MAG: DUF2065 domain-containing protein [Gammaproteobacteria bacterium]|nr:DUF2065 domain-containing protein [Gammaproteobacteria bacterium]